MNCVAFVVRFIICLSSTHLRQHLLLLRRWNLKIRMSSDWCNRNTQTHMFYTNESTHSYGFLFVSMIVFFSFIFNSVFFFFFFCVIFPPKLPSDSSCYVQEVSLIYFCCCCCFFIQEENDLNEIRITVIIGNK